MSTSYPFLPIVRDGLTHYYDAANTKSYSGSGTSWNNLTGSVAGILTNSPTFSDKYFTFNGSNTYVQLDTITVPAVISFNFWVRPTCFGF